MVALTFCAAVSNCVDLAENRIYAEVEILNGGVLYFKADTNIPFLTGVEIREVRLLGKYSVNTRFLPFISDRERLSGQPYHLLEFRVDKYLHAPVREKFLCYILTPCGEEIQRILIVMHRAYAAYLRSAVLVNSGNVQNSYKLHFL